MKGLGMAQSKANALYTEALATLRMKHADEFEDILTGLYERDGLERKRRLSATERAAVKQEAAKAKAVETIKALMEKHPDLASEVSGVINPDALAKF